ncbi:MAG: hypothetical protein M0023_11560 [Desulfobacteraceae bacterium]|nr:hypothetical protein [Desulfobacteraceae bacterium]
MSYILDALKKLENEKSRKSRKDGVINISGALFENERHQGSGMSGWKIVLAVTLVVLVTFGASWLFFRSGKGRKNMIPLIAKPAQITPAAPPAAILTAPPPVIPAVPAPQVPISTPPVPAVKTHPIRSASPARARKAAVQAATVAEDDTPRKTPQEQYTRKKDQKRQDVPAEQTMAAPTDIKLSGIAWQEEHRARRAVVNGFLVKEGDVISGARITDIYQDRVRFLLSGKSFEIPLVSSTVPAAGK